ncbi:SDR family NAD(P)-dependent oxidoreductase [Acidicapsa ligni]|uniref:SDR family NAD(P)-dependent oxidoreductase n=1 Tax=Acidicapsa ligni TaxID=542300 RepID=UPI0021DF535B|nr:SDR family NAD(P)-dependent oxidoreductase [Acidicapsa ligni]
MQSIAFDPLIQDYNTFFVELEDLSADYVIEAFQRLGWPKKQEPLSAQELASHWRIADQHGQLFARLLEIATEIGALHRDGDGFVFAEPSVTNTQVHLQILKQRYPFGEAELEMVSRCGIALAEVLTGHRDGRELVFPGGSSETAERLYRDATPARVYNQMLAKAVTSIVQARGARAIRILEVGGGTGSTTHHVIEALRAAGLSPNEYLFTDISPLLVRRANQAFANEAFLRTSVFDLENDAETQGIDGKFSIVIAVNVLHATSDLEMTIKRLKSLLADDGELLLIEVTGKQRWADITVGLLDGWWCFKDVQLRPEYPALASGQWQTFLKQSGFDRVSTIPSATDSIALYKNSVFSRQELILAGGLHLMKHILLIGPPDAVEPIEVLLRQRGAIVTSTTASKANECWHNFSNYSGVVYFPSAPEINWTAPATESMKDSVLEFLGVVQMLIDSAAQSTEIKPRLYIVTNNACATDDDKAEIVLAETPLLGIACAVALEAPALRCTFIDTDIVPTSTQSRNNLIADEIMSDSEELRIAIRSGRRHVARLGRHPIDERLSSSQPMQLSLGMNVDSNKETAGGIESLVYEPAPHHDLSADQVEIAVSATALNFRDVLKATGLLDHSAVLGTDCVGTVTRIGSSVENLKVGDAVVAVAPGCFATHAITSSVLVAAKPSQLSFADAAGQTIAYLTADYCLQEMASLRKGQRVLIHAAAGGVGLAAVFIAMRAGAEVFATAGNEQKREYLRSLGIANVYDSRTLIFKEQIIGGVDVVLNSLSEDAVDAGLSLLRPDGIFIELGKTDIRGMDLIAQQWPNIRYHAADLTPLFAARDPWVKAKLTTLMNDLATGTLPMLPVTRFENDEIKQAFRYMAAAKHIGRVVVCSAEKDFASGAHVITGGLRGIGLKLAEWLVLQGARDLILIGRRPAEQSATEVIEQLKAKGASVRIFNGDIADYEMATQVVLAAGIHLRGVWHCAGVLDNAPLAEQSWNRFATVMRPKVDGAWNLHSLTKNSKLEFFVLFSSWASIAGSRAQANHCAANAFLDALAHQRFIDGLPALSINWGAWGETGAAAGESFQRQLARSGMESMSSADAFDALKRAIHSWRPQVAIADVQWHNYRNHASSSTSSQTNSNPLYAELFESHADEISLDRSGKSHRPQPSPASSIKSVFPSAIELRALHPAARKAAIQRIVDELVHKTLDLRTNEEIDPDVPMSDLGMDSLLAIELRNSLATLFAARFSSSLLFDYPTLRALTRFIDQEIFSTAPPKLPDAAAQTANEPHLAGVGSFDHDPLSILDEIELLSDDEVDALLGKENSR